MKRTLLMDIKNMQPERINYTTLGFKKNIDLTDPVLNMEHIVSPIDIVSQIETICRDLGGKLLPYSSIPAKLPEERGYINRFYLVGTNHVEIVGRIDVGIATSITNIRYQDGYLNENLVKKLLGLYELDKPTFTSHDSREVSK